MTADDYENPEQTQTEKKAEERQQPPVEKQAHDQHAVSLAARPDEEILDDISFIKEQFKEKRYWLNIFIKASTRKRMALKYLFISVVFWLVAFLGTGLQFDGFIPNGFASDGLGSAFDFSDNAAGKELIFVPFYLFIHFFLLAFIIGRFQEAMTVVPKLFAVKREDYEVSIGRMRSNLLALSFGLPLMIYDTYHLFTDYSDQVFLVNPFVDVVIWLSWMLEWWTFGAAVYLLLAFLRFLYRITRRYKYDLNLLSIVLKGEIDPIIRLGYKLMFPIGVFLLLNVIYTLYYGFWWSDTIASIVTFLLLPLTVIAPIQIVERDIHTEMDDYILKQHDFALKRGIAFLKNPKVMSFEEKTDILLTEMMLSRFSDYRQSTITMYLRLIWVVLISALGLVFNFWDQVKAILGFFGVDLPF